MPLRSRRRLEPAARPPARRHVIFALAGVAYAVDAGQVRRSLPVPPDGAPEVRFLGQPYPLVDLRAVFRLPPSAEAGRLVLLVHTPHGRAGLVVDDLVQLGAIDEATVSPLPAAFQGAERRWFAGLGRLGARVVVLLRLDAILDASAVPPPAAASR